MRSKRRIGRKRINGRKKRTLKIRGGNLDNPDTKDFMNSKIEALEQKIDELEANMPVQIGYKALAAGIGAIGYRTIMPLFVKKNISVEDFWKYVGKGMTILKQSNTFVTIFLPALHSLLNVRGLNIEDCLSSFNTENIEENKELSKRNIDTLNAKYPGLFVTAPPQEEAPNPFAGY